MDNYLNSFREMIFLRGLTDHTLKNYCTYIAFRIYTPVLHTDHTLKNYCTYIRAYLDYLSTCLSQTSGRCFLAGTP